MNRPNDSSEPFLQAKAIRMAFGGAEVLKGVDLDLYPGEVHAILGENGAGKSTMAKIMAGVHKPTGGTLTINGSEIRLDGPRHALQLGIALIHQEPLTFPDLDVAENIFVGHQPIRGVQGIDWAAMRTKAGEMLATLGAALKPTDRVGGLSVADQQMVELAAALSHDAKALILDETTASLTPKEVAELFAIVRRLREQGRAIAFVSHRLDEVFEIADRITVLRDGEKVGEKKPSETSIAEIIRMMVGRDVTSSPSSAWPASFAEKQPILKVRNLSVTGRFDNVSFELRPGEIVGLGGLVGAGRTDVCNAIFGLTSLSGGSVEVDGQAVRIANPQKAMKLGLALVPEDRQHEGLILSMSLAENASLAILRTLAKAGWLSKAKENAAAEIELKKLQTAFRSVSQAAKELSGGNQQKIVLAKWLMSHPRVLLLDEPTRGVDIGAKSEVHRLIRELAEGGMAILMVSSDLPELLELSQRILVMREGKLVAEFPGQEANPEKVMMAASGQVAVAV